MSAPAGNCSRSRQGRCPGAKWDSPNGTTTAAFGWRCQNFGDLMGGVAVARADLAQVFPGHAVQSVDSFCIFPRHHQQLVKGLPVIAPVEK